FSAPSGLTLASRPMPPARMPSMMPVGGAAGAPFGSASGEGYRDLPWVAARELVQDVAVAQGAAEGRDVEPVLLDRVAGDLADVAERAVEGDLVDVVGVRVVTAGGEGRVRDRGHLASPDRAQVLERVLDRGIQVGGCVRDGVG